MERLLYKTSLTSIEILSEFNGLVDNIQPYLYSYATMTKISKPINNPDARVYIFDSKRNISEKNIMVNSKDKEVGLIVDDLGEKGQLSIKRLLINLNNRILENKGVVFIHGSSVSINGKGIMFVGDRGSGKTTNMLYMLGKNAVNYISNERTGLMPTQEGKKEIRMFGVPSRINIRPGALESNFALKEKLLPIVVNRGYEEALKYLTDSASLNSRMVISLQELKDILGVKEQAEANLKTIVVLKYNPNVDYKLEDISRGEMLEILEQHRINGVFSGMAELNNIVDSKNIILSECMDRNNIRFVSITQNCDNSKKILKDLSKGEIMYDNR